MWSKVRRKEGKRRDLLTRWSEKLALSDPTGPDSEWSETITCDLRSSPKKPWTSENHCIQACFQTLLCFIYQVQQSSPSSYPRSLVHKLASITSFSCIPIYDRHRDLDIFLVKRTRDKIQIWSIEYNSATQNVMKNTSKMHAHSGY